MYGTEQTWGRHPGAVVHSSLVNPVQTSPPSRRLPSHPDHKDGLPVCPQAYSSSRALRSSLPSVSCEWALSPGSHTGVPPPPTLCRAPVWKMQARPFPAVSSFLPAAKDLGASSLRGQVEQVDMPGTASSQLVSWPQPNLRSKARLGSQPLQPQHFPQSWSLVPQRSQPQTTGVGAWQVEGQRNSPGQGPPAPCAHPCPHAILLGPTPHPQCFGAPLQGKSRTCS